MRLSGSEPINLDVRNQILGLIKDGRDIKSKSDVRASLVPKGYPAPFAADQAAYEAALKGYAESNTAVTTLEARLSGMPGPYWTDLTKQENEALALWNESIKDLDKITKTYFPTPGEMDLQKLLLLAIGAGAILGPLFFSKGGDEGIAFGFIPDLSIDRVPKGLAPSMRPAAAPIPSRGMERIERLERPSPGFQPPQAPQGLVSRAAVQPRPGFTPPPRFSRVFADGNGISREPVHRIPGNVSRRPEGRRFAPPFRAKS